MDMKMKVLMLVGAIVLIVAAVSVLAYNEGVFAGDPEITEEEAKAIAEEATNGEAISVELEREGSSLVYEVIIVNETGRYEVEIDAKDGSILEIEEDDDYEDDEDEDDDHCDHDDDECHHDDGDCGHECNGCNHDDDHEEEDDR